LIDQVCRLCSRPVLAPADTVVLCGRCAQLNVGGK
jgi:hypothetical protein